MRPDSIDDLVLPVDKPVVIAQGFNGTGFHKLHKDDEDRSYGDQYSLDFILEEGSRVYAVKSGKIIDIKIDGHKNYGGDDPELIKEADQHSNYILIEHDDGTIALYAHLQQGGIANKEGTDLEIGDYVSQRQWIGLSGNTGISTAPHLHFSLLASKEGGYAEGFVRKSIPYSFVDYDGPLQDKEINPSLHE